MTTGEFLPISYRESEEEDQASTSGEMKTTSDLKKAGKEMNAEIAQERKEERRAHLRRLFAKLKSSS